MSSPQGPSSPARDLDIVVFGATGFTGQLVAAYLAEKLVAGRERAPTRWALAGRNPDKLRAVRARLAEEVDPACAELELIRASSDDRASLDAMARRARVVLTTVGPYARYGEPLVAACVEAGTDCVDLTGEPGWWREMIERYHQRAITTGARVVSCCGFDSIPHDLGALYTARELKPQPGERARVDAYVSARGGFSGGTWASAIGVFASMPAQRRARRRQGQGKREDGARSRADKPRVHFSKDVGGWVLPMATIDPLVVRRSADMSDAFGEAFEYRAFLVTKTLTRTISLVAGVGLVIALAQTGPTRRLLARMRRSGEGPPPEQRAKNWFRVLHYGRCGEREVVCRVSGGDPGYGETAKMIAESALCLAHDGDRLPGAGGVITTALAMGAPLIDRLRKAGIQFERLGPDV